MEWSQQLDPIRKQERDLRRELLTKRNQIKRTRKGKEILTEKMMINYAKSLDWPTLVEWNEIKRGTGLYSFLVFTRKFLALIYQKNRVHKYLWSIKRVFSKELKCPNTTSPVQWTQDLKAPKIANNHSYSTRFAKQSF